LSFFFPPFFGDVGCMPNFSCHFVGGVFMDCFFPFLSFVFFVCSFWELLFFFLSSLCACSWTSWLLLMR
jgi:hypothetical protein